MQDVNFIIKKKNIIVRLLLIVSFFVPFILCFPAWFSERSFPVVPLFTDFNPMNLFLDVFLLVILSLSALWFLLKSRGYGGLFFFIIYALLAILDQTRIQPFFFEIAIIVLLYFLFQKDYLKFRVAVLLLLAGTYIWSGLHKANPVFNEFWFNGLEKRIPFVSEFLRRIFTNMVPFLEMIFGVALLFNITRKLGIWCLVIMHLAILVTFAIGGIGFTVFPMNIANPLLLLLLTYNLNWNVFRLISSKGFKIRAVAFYSLLLPSLNLVGYYDHLLAFSYFSAKPEYCNIVFKDFAEIDKLPEDIRVYVRDFEKSSYININEWCVIGTNVMCYPENRVYMYLKDYIETFSGMNSTELQFYK